MNEFLHKYQLFNISEFLLEIILVFIFKINFSTPFDPRAVQNTDLHSNSNISKTSRVNIDFKKKQQRFLKEYLISFLMIFSLIDFALVILELLMFKNCGIIGISKIEFFSYSGTERVKIKKALVLTKRNVMSFVPKIQGLFRVSLPINLQFQWKVTWLLVKWLLAKPSETFVKESETVSRKKCV